MDNISRMYESEKSIVIRRDNMPEAVQALLLQFVDAAEKLGHSINIVDAPHIRRFIVAPVISNADLDSISVWRNCLYQRSRKSTYSGRDLVLWLDHKGIACRPITVTNQSSLENI